MSASQRHRIVLDAVTADLEADGYDVFIEPSASLLPDEVKALHIRPDAVALGRKPHLLVEVIATKGRNTDDRLFALEQAIGQKKDWQMHVVYAPPASSATSFPPPDEILIRRILDRALAVYDNDGVVPALLTVWSAFEAAARNHMPMAFERPRGAKSLVERLASDGILLPDEADRLRALAQWRNEAAHGRLDTPLERTELEWLAAVARDLLDRAPLEQVAGG